MHKPNEIVEEIRTLFQQKGDSQYGGEGVTQLEHALQAAALAEAEGRSPATIVSALLHDVGHLLHDLDDDAPDQGIDDVHEARANEWLKDHFSEEVTEPIRLHVAAKRYLCTVEPGYLETLSEPSVVSLQLQGGLLNEAETQEFESHPLFDEIIQVRRYDDLAKVSGLKTPEIEHYIQYVAQAAHAHLSPGVNS